MPRWSFSDRLPAAGKRAPVQYLIRCGRNREIRSPSSEWARVGQAGPLAARTAGCEPIIAVDVHEPRLALAQALGATHVINHRGRTDVVAEIRRITGEGVRFSLETSAQPAVLRESVEALIAAGTCVLLGSARRGTEVSFEMPFLQFGRM